MKKILFSTCALAIALVIGGCAKDGADLYSSSSLTPTVGIGDSELILDGNTEQSRILIEANFWWKAYVVYASGETEQWCELSPSEGYGNIKIDVATTRNYDLAHAREATIVIVSDVEGSNFRKEFAVVQKVSAPYIHIAEVDNDGTLQVPVLSSSKSLEINTNDTWSAVSEQPAWCHIDASGGAGKTLFSIVCDINTAGVTRTSKVTLTADNSPGLKYEFTIAQRDTFEATELSVVKTPTAFAASWSEVIGAMSYTILIDDASGAPIGTIDAGSLTSFDLAADNFFATPQYAGYVTLSIRANSADANVFSVSNEVGANSHFTSGKGTQSDPFIIADTESLANVAAANSVTANAGAYYLLDFVPSSDQLATIAPVCTPAKPFAGNFNGNNKEIVGWVRNEYADLRNYSALFGGIAQGATVSNIRMTGCTLSISKSSTGSISTTNNGFAFVAAVNNGTISAITLINPEISCADGTTPLYVGAIAGVNNGTIEKCISNGGKLSSGPSRKKDVFDCGAICARNTTSGKIVECFNKGTEILGTNNIGGIAGLSDGLISGCGNSGKVTGNYYLGGLVGYIISSGNATFRIENSYNTGTVVMDEEGAADKQGAAYVGGIISRIHSVSNTPDVPYSMENCFNSGNMIIGKATSSSNLRVGGLVGHTNNTGHIRNCYFSGTITILDNAKTNCGGIAGELAADKSNIVEYCYSVGTISKSAGVTGGIFNALGNAPATGVTLDYVYALDNGGLGFANRVIGTTSGLQADADLKDSSSGIYSTWDMASVWHISGGYPYPQLRTLPHKNAGQ